MIGTPARRRVLLTFMDQSVSSVSNFATGVVVARLAGATQFGHFMLTFMVWLLAVGLHRALVSESVIVNCFHNDNRRALLAQGVSAVFLLGAVLSAVVAVSALCALAAGGKVGAPMLALSPWLIPLLLQDYWRSMAFLQRRPDLALVNDCTFIAVQAAAMAAFAGFGWRSAGHMITAWGIGATAGALLGFRWFPVVSRLREGWFLLRRLWPVSQWMLADFLSGFVSERAYLGLVAFLLVEADYGGFRAAFSLMGPIMVILHAGANVGLPEASRRADPTDFSKLQPFARVLTAVTLVCVAVYAAVVVVTGSHLMAALYGQDFASFAPLASLAALQYVIMVSVFGQSIALKATGRVRLLWRARVFVAAASLTSMILLVRWLGTVGAGWAGVATGVCFAAGIAIAYRSELGRPTAAGPDEPPFPPPPTTPSVSTASVPGGGV